MIQAMRRVLPPTWVLAMLVPFYLLLFAPALLRYALESCWEDELLQIPQRFVLLGCAAYGLYRVLAFHPAFRPTYKQWLQASPWTARLPLPLGPIHLAWQDGIVLLAAEILLWKTPTIPATYPALVMLVPYLIVLACLLLITGLPRTGCCILLGLGALVHLAEHPGWALVMTVGIYLVAYVALRRSLQLFPWDQAKLSDSVDKIQQALTKPNQSNTTLLWPFNRLQPFDPQPLVTLETAAWISLVAGWYAHIFLTLALDAPASEHDIFVTILFTLGMIVVPGIRVLVYCIGYRSPISILGRIFTLRWIIPGYDRVFVAPICAAMAGIIVQLVLGRLGAADHIALPIATGVTLMLTLTLGPTLGSWRLTGSHRLSPGLTGGNVFIKI